MLQIEIFSLDKKGSKEANDFIRSHRLIENGVQVRENCICVLYDDSPNFDKKNKEVALISKLVGAEANLLAGEIEKEFFELMEAGGKMSAEALAAKEKNTATLENLKAQIFILKKKLGNEVKEESIFGKKQYHEKA